MASVDEAPDADCGPARLGTDQLKIDDVMKRLAADRQIFHSEADFQHALAWKIHELRPHAKIRLEVSSRRFDKRERLDILVHTTSISYAIELKYKKRKLECEWAGEAYALANDGAQDIGRYDFFKDISRLERYVTAESNAIGYAVLLTNDDLYWRESARGVNSAAFFLHEGRVVDCSMPLAWHDRTGEGTKKGRTEPFKLNTDRLLSWKDYSSLPNLRDANFRYLALQVVSNANV